MTPKTLRILILCLLNFLGLSGLYGGYKLMTDPTGGSLKMPLKLIEETPFQDYLIPGIILFSTIGILSIVIALLVLYKIKFYPIYIMGQGVVLIIWLTTELLLNIEFLFPPLHIPYYITGILLVVMGWQVYLIAPGAGTGKIGE